MGKTWKIFYRERFYRFDDNALALATHVAHLPTYEVEG